jgi:hypothetical protein
MERRGRRAQAQEKTSLLEAPCTWAYIGVISHVGKRTASYIADVHIHNHPLYAQFSIILIQPSLATKCWVSQFVIQANEIASS